MKPTAEYALLTVYRVMRDLGPKKPKNEVVLEAVRSLGHAFGDTEAKRILAAERQRDSIAPQAQAEASQAQTPVNPGATQAQEKALRADAGAGVEVLVIASSQGHISKKPTPLPPPSEPSLFGVAPKPKPRPMRFDTRSAAEQVADAVLAELRPVIEPVLVGIRWTKWCQRGNRRAVAEMADSGMTAGEIIAAHTDASEARGEVAVVMSWVQKRVIERGSRRPDEQNASTALPTLTELYESGAVERPDTAAIVAERPAWVNERIAAMMADA